MKQGWKEFRRSVRLAILIAITVFLLVQAIRVGYSMPEMGFGPYTLPNGEFVPAKTAWDWMVAFTLPVVVAMFIAIMNNRQRWVEQNRAEERANLERELTTDRQQEVALQSYLDRMAELLLEKKLRTSRNKEVRNVARIRTLTALLGLDGNRKRLVLLFLKESGLIGQQPIIDLTGADFSGVWLSEDNLSGVNLSRAELSDAYMYLTILSNAVLSGADLSGANLSDADLSQTNLSRVLLTAADLTRANLTNANLTDADLTEAILTNVDLTGANLSGAHLGGFLPSNDKQLLATVRSLKGATMPDGTKHD